MSNESIIEYMALLFSVISIIFTGLTFWLTRIRKGTLKMTRPVLICFLGKNGGDEPKVFFRTLLYGTSDQGQYIENMYLRISRGEVIQNFNIWMYKENEKHVRGSGLFVTKGGISTYHHFLLPKNEHWVFFPGEYQIEFYAETVGKSAKKIYEQKLLLTNEQSNSLENGKGIHFNWAPNSAKYLSHTEE